MGKEKPCEEAVWEKYTRVDRRTFKSPEEHDEKLCNCEIGESSQPWLSEGTNHRIVESGIERDFDDAGWFVRLGSLNDLRAFSAKYGELVVTAKSAAKRCPSLEIYDDYRE